MEKKSHYLPALDGFRALSILLVLVGHLGFEKIVPGGLGVNIFFYISGLLITNLLLNEFEKSGKIDFKKFFIRRILRLYPPLLAMVIFVCVVPALNGKLYFKEVTAALFYFENYYYVFNSFGPNSHGFAGAKFMILWSLSIEEHFYLIFPFLFAFLISRKTVLVFVISAITLLALLFRVYIVNTYGPSAYTDTYTYYTTACRADAIMFGCLSSILLRYDKKRIYLKFASSIPVFSISIAAVFFSIIFRNEVFRETVRYSLQSIAFMLIIPPVLYSSKYTAVNKVLSGQLLVFIGRLSYSLYLFHVFVYGLVNECLFKNKSPILLYCIVGVAGTFVMALISYYTIEKPIMSLRRKFGSVVSNKE